MALSIPNSHKKALARIASLSAEQAQKLAAAFIGAKPTISARQLAVQISGKAEYPASDLAGILIVLLSLLLTRKGNASKHAEQIASEVATAAASQEVPGVQDGSLAQRALRENLQVLLAHSSELEVSARASEVYFAHETLFRSARVLSDIRPIFSMGDDMMPAAGMIVHNLELQAFAQGRDKKCFVAMNVHDLRELRSVIDRALQKDAHLKSLIESARLHYIEDLPNEHQK